MRDLYLDVLKPPIYSEFKKKPEDHGGSGYSTTFQVKPAFPQHVFDSAENPSKMKAVATHDARTTIRLGKVD